jgi:hypothetical protein
MAMSNFKQEMQEYLKHGTMAFSFGDLVLPVIYREGLNVLTVQMSSKEVMVPVSSNMDFYENLDVLMAKLLKEFPELEY